MILNQLFIDNPTILNLTTKVEGNNRYNNGGYDISLKHICLWVICNHSQDVLKLNYFVQHLRYQVIEMIIKHDFFNCNEENLWNTLVEWAVYQSQLHVACSSINKDCKVSGTAFTNNNIASNAYAYGSECNNINKINDDNDGNVTTCVLPTGDNTDNTDRDDLKNERKDTHDNDGVSEARMNININIDNLSQEIKDGAFALLQFVYKYIKYDKISPQFYFNHV